MYRPTRPIVGHFADKSFQAIDCTATDNQTHQKENTRKQKMHRHTKN